MKCKRYVVPGLLTLCCALTIENGCATARADRAGPSDDLDTRHAAASMTIPDCEDDYDVVGAVRDGVETESIDGNVFTDADPFECECTTENQEVDFTFNASTTDPVTGCSYNLTYSHKGTSTPFSGTQTLTNSTSDEIHFGVVATPIASDPDCHGLSEIEVDPKILVRRNREIFT